ncbi:hypothetical protein FRC07_008437, partial [Ceratobasidium sp. 392]
RHWTRLNLQRQAHLPKPPISTRFHRPLRQCLLIAMSGSQRRFARWGGDEEDVVGEVSEDSAGVVAGLGPWLQPILKTRTQTRS